MQNEAAADGHRRTTWGWAGVALVLALPVIGLLSAGAVHGRIVREPFPAIAMPRFAGAGGAMDGNRITTREPVLYVAAAGGSERAYAQERIFAGLPRSHHSTLARDLLYPTADGLAEPQRRWLRAAARRLGGDDARSARLVWYDATFAPGHDGPVTREVDVVVTLDLATSTAAGAAIRP